MSGPRKLLAFVVVPAFLALATSGCTSPGSPSTFGGRPVQISIETAEQHAFANASGTIEASAGMPAATLYILDEYQWDRVRGKSRLAEMKRAQTAGETERAAELRTKLLEDIDPWRIEGAHTPHREMVQPEPLVVVGVRGDQIALATCNALNEDMRHVDLHFD